MILAGTLAPRGQDQFNVEVGQVEESLQLDRGEGRLVGAYSLFRVFPARLNSEVIWTGSGARQIHEEPSTSGHGPNLPWTDSLSP
ncbi:hypothetical protein PJ267_03210 [Arthrobacter sp. OVS8]|nr:hypothetical protein PJ267_03210 [Arthrobacter sp. OVS8]